jgi:hypothetical protein
MMQQQQRRQQQEQQLEVTLQYEWLSDDVVRRMIVWIMGWPAGFKLNDALDKFIGALCLLVLDCWSAFVLSSKLLILIRPIWLLILIGPLGLSLQVMQDG